MTRRVMALIHGPTEKKTFPSSTQAIELPDNQKLVVARSVQSKASKYWMMTSVALNVLFLSALLCRIDLRDFRKSSAPGVGQNIETSACEALLQTMAPSNQICSGRGHYEYDQGTNGGGCRCSPCFAGSNCSEVVRDCVINFDQGDPKMFETYWLSNQDATTTVILGWQRMSYFANTKDSCWFLEPELATEIRALHKSVGNAVADNHHIIVGTGSSQLIHAALYALSSSSGQKPIDVVSAVPFYSSYPSMTDYLQSGLHRWAGDASTYEPDDENGYIELVTSPSNPDGMLHKAVVNGTGPVIHDMAYYWPHFTPITSPADHDIMLFTVSKSTGHAGTRIGWALVRDSDVAKRMTKYIELSTIGVSKDSQLRVSQILKSINNAYSYKGDSSHKLANVVNGASTPKIGHQANISDHNHLFHYGYMQMESRWEQLQAAVDNSNRFTIEEFTPALCSFFGKETVAHPAFAWLRCEKEDDCHAVFKAEGILTRSGIHFGASAKYVRISMVDRKDVFDLFIERLRSMTRSDGSSRQRNSNLP